MMNLRKRHVHCVQVELNFVYKQGNFLFILGARSSGKKMFYSIFAGSRRKLYDNGLWIFYERWLKLWQHFIVQQIHFFYWWEYLKYWIETIGQEGMYWLVFHRQYPQFLIKNLVETWPNSCFSYSISRPISLFLSLEMSMKKGVKKEITKIGKINTNQNNPAAKHWLKKTTCSYYGKVDTNTHVDRLSMPIFIHLPP